MNFVQIRIQTNSIHGYLKWINEFAVGLLLICAILLSANSASAQSNDGVPTDFTLARPSNTSVLTEVGSMERALARAMPTMLRLEERDARFQLFVEVPAAAFRLDEAGRREDGGGIVPEGLGLGLGSDARPYVVKYACCEDTELFQAPRFDANIIERADVGTEVWVFDTFGVGLPNGITDCFGVPAPCPQLWAEVFSNDIGRAGYMPLTALFERRPIGERGATQFEVSFDRINRAFADSLAAEVITPQGCGDPGNTIVFRPSEFGYRDQFLGFGETELQSCERLIENPVVRDLMPCAGFEPDEPIFQRCIFATLDECRNGVQPTRPPAAGLSLCVASNRAGSGTCADCREWYDITGQSDAGWQTETELVNACRDELEVDGNTCNANNCIDFCQNWANTAFASACQRYLGPTDEKWFGDPADYECGEIPVGRTHPGFSQSTAVRDEAWGEPDFDWKVLETVMLPNPKVGTGAGGLLPSIFTQIRLGRIGDQRPVSISVADLTSRAERQEQTGAALDPMQFWLSLVPGPKSVALDTGARELDVLEAEICAFLPGNRIDLGEWNLNQNEDGLFAIIQEVDFGTVAFEQADLCVTVDLYVDPAASDIDAEDVQAAGIDVGDLVITSARVSGVDFTPGPATAGAAFTPLVDVIVRDVVGKTKALTTVFGNLDTPIEGRIFDYGLNRYATELGNALEDPLQDLLEEGLDEARAGVRESLSDVCDALSPAAPLGSPFHYFYRWVEWNCTGIAQNNLIRPFLPNDASAAAGCYDGTHYFTPADAGRTAWWTAYTGQTWYWAGFPDSGCRIAAVIRSEPDRAFWRPLRCGSFVFNAWFNNGPTPGGSFAAMIADTCREAGEVSLRDLYGTNEDLAKLYHILHPINPVAPFGELEIE